MTATSSDALLDRMMQLHPKVIDLVLDRVWRLLAALDHPENALPPVIHLAGTNGKGSTQAMLRAGIEGAGLSTHAYTSPHLVRFHERIRLAGELISEQALSELLDECLAANGPDPITYFEITTCAAILAFARTPADWCLLETGLGGRLDATNVVEKPALTVITPISMDHESFLGDTITQIAGEKAGILKPGVPCVVGPQTPEALEVLEARAMQIGAPLLVHGQDWQVWSEHGRLVFQDLNGLLDLPLPNLPGAHQLQNAGAALAALRHLGFDEAACEAAVTSAQWDARLQRLRRGPLVSAALGAEILLDGGHNPAAGEALCAHLETLPARPTHMICGMLNTKDVRGYLRPLASQVASLHAVSIPGVSATLTGAETAQAARDAGHDAQEAASVQEALAAIIATDPQARVLIGGSLYLAGTVLEENG